MKQQIANTKALFALLTAGLWEQEVRLLPYGEISFKEIFRLANEQAVIGLIAAGINHAVDVNVPKEVVLSVVGQTLQLEQKNSAMNRYIVDLVEKMRAEGIDTILVKGQGIAQCYERPLWRSCGDIDLLLNEEDYNKAKLFMSPLATSIEPEIEDAKHLEMLIGPWEVELHGTLHSGLSRRIDNVLDQLCYKSFTEGQVRFWMNGTTQVLLPCPDNDVIFVFSHILQHFFKGGIGLRQVCDWCRLLWTYQDIIDKELLETRICEMKLMTEWKAFSTLSVDYLGMPTAALPFYSRAKRWKKKSDRIVNFVLKTGNFGHNRDTSYIGEKKYIIRKSISLWRHNCDNLTRFFIFPLDSLRTWGQMLVNGMKMAVKGK